MKGHRAAKGRSEPKADGGCGGSSSLAAEALKLGRGSDASGGGRRAAAAPNMHSLATAAVSDWAAWTGPRTPFWRCVSASSPSSLCRSRSPAPPALNPRGPHRPPRHDLAMMEPAPTSLAGRLVASRAALRFLFRPQGLVPRPERLSCGRYRPFIDCTDQQFPGASCVLCVGRDEGNSVSNMTGPRALGTPCLGTSQREGDGF